MGILKVVSVWYGCWYECGLKGVIWVHNNKIRSNGLEMSQLGTQ